MKRRQRIFMTGEAEEYIKLFEKKGIPHRIDGFSHSDTVTTDNCVYVFSKEFNKNVIPIFTKIKFDILRLKKNLGTTPMPVFYITGRQMANLKMDQEIKFGSVINIDIKKAYPTCLLLNGFIGDKTYKYLLEKNKLDVLKSIGVLGSHKVSMKFDGRKHSVPKLTRKPYLSDVLKFIQYEIGRVMVRISNHYKRKNQFLFFWTDGVYLTPDADKSYAERYLSGLGYKYETLYLRNFSINKYQGVHKPLLKIKFLKSKKDGWKEFNIPEKKLSMYKEW